MGTVIQIFTDGSCSGNPGPGGWAFVEVDTFYQERGFNKHTTNNEMELFAIHKALEYAKKKEATDVKIVTDSLYSMNVCLGYWQKKKNTELITKIEEQIKEFKSVGFQWVKGHSGNQYNELVDKLAKG